MSSDVKPLWDTDHPERARAAMKEINRVLVTPILYHVQIERVASLVLGLKGERVEFCWRPYAMRSPDHQADYDRWLVSIFHGGIRCPLITWEHHVLIGMRRDRDGDVLADLRRCAAVARIGSAAAGGAESRVREGVVLKQAEGGAWMIGTRWLTSDEIGFLAMLGTHCPQDQVQVHSRLELLRMYLRSMSNRDQWDEVDAVQVQSAVRGMIRAAEGDDADDSATV